MNKFPYYMVLPVNDGGITNGYSESHRATDWGWKTEKYCPIFAVQDGIVVDVGYEPWNTSTGSGIGYYVVIQCNYDDGTHRFAGYIHLKEQPIVSLGQSVKAGQQMGLRGGSPYKSDGSEYYAVHLHLYLTNKTSKPYSWNTMKNLSADPFSTPDTIFCKYPGINYDMSLYDGHNFNNAPIYPGSDYEIIIKGGENVRYFNLGLIPTEEPYQALVCDAYTRLDAGTKYIGWRNPQKQVYWKVMKLIEYGYNHAHLVVQAVNATGDVIDMGTNDGDLTPITLDFYISAVDTITFNYAVGDIIPPNGQFFYTIEAKFKDDTHLTISYARFSVYAAKGSYIDYLDVINNSSPPRDIWGKRIDPIHKAHLSGWFFTPKVNGVGVIKNAQIGKKH